MDKPFINKDILVLFTLIVLSIIYYVINGDKTPCTCGKQTIITKVVTPKPFVDTVRQYDYRKMNDPLEEPVRRVPRHEIHPLHMKRLIDQPTRGYPDNFVQSGILVKDRDHKDHDDKENKHTGDNKILRLFSRQDYPGSNKYEYYIMINSGLDRIKVPLSVRKRELYDGDKVVVKELGTRYRVQLHDYDAPKYYPDIIY